MLIIFFYFLQLRKHFSANNQGTVVLCTLINSETLKEEKERLKYSSNLVCKEKHYLQSLNLPKDFHLKNGEK